MVSRVLFDLGIKKKLFNQTLRFHPCAATSIDYLLRLLQITGYQEFIKKETLVQLISCEFCEISENTSFTEHLWATASGYGGTVKIEEFSGTRQKTDDGRK